MMNIKILGSGCSSCKKLEADVREAVRELAIEADVEKVTDFKAIASYGVMLTPGLVIDEKVRLSGKVPTKAEIMSLITTVLAES